MTKKENKKRTPLAERMRPKSLDHFYGQDHLIGERKILSQLVEAEQQGWGAVSLKLTIDPEPYINRKPRYRWITEHQENYHVFTLVDDD